MNLSLANLLNFVTMSAYHLRRSEVEYELKVRSLPFEGTAAELRKQLTLAVGSNKEVDEAAVNALDTTVEFEECETKYQDLSALVSDYEGNHKDNEFHRIVARLWHLYLRANRIPVGATMDDDEDQTKELLVKKSKELLDSFKDKDKDVADESRDVKTTKEDIPQPLRGENRPEGLSIGKVQENRKQEIDETQGKAEHLQEEKRGTENYARPRYVPVYKWGIKFDSTGPSIASFLERVEELRRARGVTHQELFDSSVDLFAGSALIWYRSSASRIHSWVQLCKELKEVFQPPDYDFRLQQEIFNRFQGEKESVDLYVAAMEGLYGRLSGNVPETTRLAQVFHNLHPQLQDRLALVDIKTMDDLRTMGRRVEAGRLRQTRPRPSPSPGSSLEPDLAYQEPFHRRAPVTGRVAAITEETTPRRFSGACWNCGREGHRFTNCRNPRKKFCYGCGKDDTFKRDCETCRPKNGVVRESAN